jgi:hypothetical protein
MLIPAAAQRGVQNPLPDLPSAAVSISWEDLKGLLLKLQPDKTLEREIEPAPVPWTVSKSYYAAKAGADHSVRIDAVFDIVVWKDRGWAQIPIVGGAIAPVDITLDGDPTSLVADEAGWFTLLINKPGPHRLELSFFIQAQAADGVVSFEFPSQRSSQTHMTLEVPVPEARVSSPVAAHTTTRQTEGALIADLELRTTDTVAVQWELPAAPGQQVDIRPPVPPRITSFTTTLASLTDQYVSCESRVQYSVLRGETDAFRLRLPVRANVLEVMGQGAEWVHSEDGEYQYVDVKVNHRITDNYTLALRYEVPFEGEEATLVVPELVTEGVMRTKGYIGIAAVGNVKVAVAPTLEGVTRAPISELPAELRARSSNPFLYAFKYVENAYLLALDVRKLEDVAVRVASIDRATLTTVVMDNGMVVTRAVYAVRNNEKQFLRIQVGEGTEVWGAQVGGRPVKPAQDNESGSILIPLSKSAQTLNQLGTFTVELVYKSEIGDTFGLSHSIGVVAPATDILANEVTWEVWTPESRRVYRSDGDLEPLKMGSAMRTDLARHPVGAERETLFRLREGIERFMITDINNPGASGAGGGDSRYRGKPLDESEDAAQGARRGPSDALVAGVLPIRITLPTVGQVNRFQGVLIPKGKALGLVLHTYPASMESGAKVALSVLGAIVGLVLHWRVGRRLAVTNRVVFALAAAVGVVGVLAFMVSTLAGLFVSGLLVGAGVPALVHRVGRGPLLTSEPKSAREES